MANPERGGYTPDNKKSKGEPERKDSKIYVGAKENPDGSWDYSKALIMEDPEGKIAGSIEDHTKKTEQERIELQEKHKRVGELKRGNADTVRDDLEVGIRLNKSEAEISTRSKGTDHNLEHLIEDQKMELDIFNDVGKNFSRDLIKNGLIENKRITAEEAESKFRNLSAIEMQDLVQKNVEYYLLQQDRGAKDAGLSELDARDSKRKYDIKDLLKSAENLQNELKAEALAGKKIEDDEKKRKDALAQLEDERRK